MKKPALLILMLIFLIITLSVVRIFVSNNVTTSGLELGKLEEKIKSYRVQNNILAEKLYSLSSLTNISQKAYDLGYTENKSEIVLTQKLPVALKQ